MSHLRHDFLNDFAANLGGADAVASRTASSEPLAAWLPGDELDESSDDAVELVVSGELFAFLSLG
jgi:hypothetical protein